MVVQQPHWYAVYTRARHEKRVERILQRMDLETYLPLRKALGSRPDTRQMVEVPALPGYLFVHCSLSPERRAAINGRSVSSAWWRTPDGRA
jgi:transcription antitermination factor NusG